MAYNWNNMFGTIVEKDQSIKHENSLNHIIETATEYLEYHCSAHNTEKFASWDVTYNGTLKSSHDSTYKSYNSYNSGKLSTNYSGYNSSHRYSYFGGNVG